MNAGKDAVMRKLWLWDVDGPAGCAGGVTGSEKAAMRAAEEAMGRTGASTAVVELASLAGGGLWMCSRYQRSGYERAATVGAGGAVTWSRLERPGGAVGPGGLGGLPRGQGAGVAAGALDAVRAAAAVRGGTAVLGAGAGWRGSLLLAYLGELAGPSRPGPCGSFRAKPGSPLVCANCGFSLGSH